MGDQVEELGYMNFGALIGQEILNGVNVWKSCENQKDLAAEDTPNPFSVWKQCLVFLVCFPEEPDFCSQMVFQSLITFSCILVIRMYFDCARQCDKGLKDKTTLK